LAGLLMLAGMIWFFSSGYTPPGICGEVLRHNQQNDIDASPLIYSDVDNMHEIEHDVMLMRRKSAAAR